MSNDRVGSGDSNNWLRLAGVLEFADQFTLPIAKLNGRTAKRQGNQLA
jgi:hypothetical protein